MPKIKRIKSGREQIASEIAFLEKKYEVTRENFSTIMSSLPEEEHRLETLYWLQEFARGGTPKKPKNGIHKEDVSKPQQDRTESQ